jgi:CheY-like chemotaxis protein
VEDNSDAASTLARLLQRLGHKVAVAPNGIAGIAAVHDTQAEVLLCDVGLPGDVDGYEVARRLRAELPGRRILMLALTGYGQDQDQQRAKAAGFDYHFTKPIDLEQIETVITEWHGRL